MGSMSKLLSRTFRFIIGYAVAVLVASVPAYYYLVDAIWQRELTEHNRIVAEGIEHHLSGLRLSRAELEAHLKAWNTIRPEMTMTVADRIRPDSLYNVYRYNTYSKHDREDRFQGLVTYFEREGQVYRLTVETNMEESRETVMALTAVTVLFLAILLVGFVFLNRRLSVRLWRPFYNTLRQIRGFDLSRPEPPSFQDTSITEFRELNDGLSKLIEGNMAAYTQQKHFIENAAHELQTPLAVVQSKLDLLLQDPELTGGQSGAIEEAYRALLRVNRINRNLLMLARIENSQFPDTESVEIGEVAAENLDFSAEFMENKRLTVRFDPKEQLSIPANRTLVEILVSNLLRNAIRYSPADSLLGLSVEGRCFTVTNPGTQPLRSDVVFQRFGRANRDEPGTGLGLAIAAQICARYGWTIAYRFEEKSHIFSVTF
ncbi:Signal transduction histidine kinase [Siphonobacter aquaeclarae]|uniref:histidine kinase n=2 Tax=Siphonobacter aquaeclarae TaxID=563176 RepID=A0A1G9Y4C8_9BACT|nr:Signal transduction histidine kinase [Siphonobacter aquaeclarae]